MPSFTVTDYHLAIFNTRSERGALRAIELTGRCATPEGDVDARVRLWCIAGEPRPRVDEVLVEEGMLWDVSFPNGHYDAVVDLLRNEENVSVTVEPPESLTIERQSS